MTESTEIQDNIARGGGGDTRYLYDQWMEAQGVPIHKGYFIEDLRTVEVAPWYERECNAAFIQLQGMEGVAEARVTEIEGGGSVPPMKFALDEVIYTLIGQGIATVWADGVPKHSFEFGPRSLFLIPRGAYRQFANARGDQPLRLLHNNYLPVAMSMEPDPDFYFNNSFPHPELLQPKDEELYAVASRAKNMGRGATWYGNYFTDMGAWNDLVPHRQRGGGGYVVDVSFPHSQMGGHMSVFPPGTYKKGHRHGPGRVIVIPAGEGYSILWPEGQEKVVAPWHEGSMFTPPGNWFHQHFNTSETPARYLALAPMPQFAGHEEVSDTSRNQIEYPLEESWIREKYEEELAKRDLKSLMPEEAYTNAKYKWGYADGEEQGAHIASREA